MGHFHHRSFLWVLVVTFGLSAIALGGGCSPQVGRPIDMAAKGYSYEYTVGYMRALDEAQGHKGIPYGWPEAETLGVLNHPQFKAGYDAGKAEAARGKQSLQP